jgi:hypothetical protein
MTCPDCRDTGIISRPYIAGVVSTMTACTCDAGRQFAADIAALHSAQPVGARVRPWETRPADPDAMIPATVEVHRGAWAVVIGTNGKPAGWIDTHDLFASQLYRDHILTTPAALLPAGEGE